MLTPVLLLKLFTSVNVFCNKCIHMKYCIQIHYTQHIHKASLSDNIGLSKHQSFAVWGTLLSSLLSKEKCLIYKDYESRELTIMKYNEIHIGWSEKCCRTGITFNCFKLMSCQIRAPDKGSTMNYKLLVDIFPPNLHPCLKIL